MRKRGLTARGRFVSGTAPVKIPPPVLDLNALRPVAGGVCEVFAANSVDKILRLRRIRHEHEDAVSHGSRPEVNLRRARHLARDD
jgi:hypothetical protein